MNLNAIASPIVATVNPMVTVLAQVSAGPSAPLASGKRVPQFETPGQLVASISGTTLTVTSRGAGVLRPGQLLAGTDVAVATGTAITAQVSGDPGDIGVYTVNRSQTIAEEPMTTFLSLRAQVQPVTWRDLQQMEGLNLSGNRMALYVNGDLNGIVRVGLKGGDLIALPNGTVWLIAQQLEGFNLTAGWTKAAMTLQNEGTLATGGFSLDFSDPANSGYIALLTAGL